MELDVLKLHTTWNDAANSINTNFSKIQMAIASLGTGGGGLNEDELRAFLVVYLTQNGYATKDDIDNAISDIINGAPSTLDTLKEIADALAESDEIIVALNNAIGTKASKEELNEGLNTLANSKITISGVDVSLGGEITQQELRTGLGLETLVDWYNRVGVAFGKKGDGTYYVAGDFLTEGQFAAAAVGTEGGGSVGAAYLSDLYDVSLGSLLSGDILSWNGSEWVNIKQSSLVPDLSAYASKSFVSDALEGYLPKSGGTISGSLQIGNDDNTAYNYLRLVREGYEMSVNCNAYGGYISYGAIGAANAQLRLVSDSITFNGNTLLHSGNYSNYALPLSGGTIEGSLAVTGYISNRGHYILALDNDNADWYVTDKSWNHQYAIVHSGNIGSQSVAYASNAGTLGGYAASYASNSPFGTIPVVTQGGYFDIGRGIEFHHDNTGWGDFSTYLNCTGNHGNVVDLPSASGTLALTTDNVASATKLATPRTIWGQSFDGTGDVDGVLTTTEEFIIDTTKYSDVYWARGVVWKQNGYELGNLCFTSINDRRISIVHGAYDSSVGLHILSNGYAGLGVVSPNTALHVKAPSHLGITVESSTSIESSIVYKDSSAREWIAGIGVGSMDNSFGFWTNTNLMTVMSLQNNGNVLIGTRDDRGHRLTVGRPDGAANLTSTTLNNSLLFVGMSESVYSYGTNFWTEGSGNGFIQQGRTDDEQPALYDLILQPFGRNVGIGTPNPQHALDVVGEARATSLRLNNSSFAGLFQNSAITTGGNSTDIWLYNSDGKVLIYGNSEIGLTAYVKASSNIDVVGSLIVHSGITTNEITIGGIRLDVYDGALRVNGDIFSTGQFAASVAGEATGSSNIVLDYASIVNALGYTPANNNSLAQVAFTGSYADLSNKPTSLPASDVYSWAKASVKPTYSWSEIQSRPDVYTKQEVDDKLSDIGGGEGCNCDDSTSGLGDSMYLYELNGVSYDVPNGVNCVMVTENATLDFSNVIPLVPSRPCIMYLVKTDDYTLQVNFSSKIEAANSNGGLVSQFSVDGYTGMMLVWDTDYWKWHAYIQKM